ncbi:uncharacterized protein LOC128932853 [Melozone crissalis]|uniref:uncharacterized protein LOC128932853 n=1 Tax=Melozone crissalis TaxID=40204 RepID=UPI0023DC6982|nr:uncharacterized protein LOC128932853 [Melozone crissalis]
MSAAPAPRRPQRPRRRDEPGPGRGGSAVTRTAASAGPEAAAEGRAAILEAGARSALPGLKMAAAARGGCREGSRRSRARYVPAGQFRYRYRSRSRSRFRSRSRGVPGPSLPPQAPPRKRRPARAANGRRRCRDTSRAAALPSPPARSPGWEGGGAAAPPPTPDSRARQSAAPSHRANERRRLSGARGMERAARSRHGARPPR